MKFTIVTPCWNAEARIARTIQSIQSQTALHSGRASLEYIVCDGDSRDRTVELVRELTGPGVEILSERDRGMYDALAKGLRRASGDVVAYLNAGDSYFPTAFDVVADVMESGRATWLTGLKVLLNEAGQPIRVTTPYGFSRRLIRGGIYGRHLPFIQQESTFWRRELTALADLERLATFRLAGDYYLWTCFAQKHDLAVVESLLGAFLVHAGQQSEQMDAYIGEVSRICGRPGVLDLATAAFQAPLWLAPPAVKKAVCRDRYLRWSASGWR